MREVFQQSRFRTDLKRVRRSGRYKLEDVLDVIAKPANKVPGHISWSPGLPRLGPCWISRRWRVTKLD